MSNLALLRPLTHPSNTLPPAVLLFANMTQDDDKLIHLYGHGAMGNPVGIFWHLMENVDLPRQVDIVGVVVTILPPGHIAEPSLWDLTKAATGRGYALFKNLKPKVHIPRWHGIWWN